MNNLNNQIKTLTTNNNQQPKQPSNNLSNQPTTLSTNQQPEQPTNNLNNQSTT
jgi:hypothetical protein